MSHLTPFEKFRLLGGKLHRRSTCRNLLRFNTSHFYLLAAETLDF